MINLFVGMVICMSLFNHVCAYASDELSTRPTGIASQETQEKNQQMKAWWDQILYYDNMAYKAFEAGDLEGQKEFQQLARKLREQFYDAREWQEKEYKKRLDQEQVRKRKLRRKTI